MTDAINTAAAIAEGLTLSQMVALYNDRNESSPVKAFQSKAKGAERLAAICAEQGLAIIATEDGVDWTPVNTEEQGGTDDQPQGGTDDQPQGGTDDQPQGGNDEGHDWSVEGKAEGPVNRRALVGEYPDTAFAVPLVASAKRGKRGVRFAQYGDGCTAGTYLDRCVEAEGKTRPRHKYRKDLRWDVEHGLIVVGKDEAEARALAAAALAAKEAAKAPAAAPEATPEAAATPEQAPEQGSTADSAAA